ncbi:MAG: type II toxin-antitoxin system HicB family antitoxin [Alphaproteobacteria bacterium]|nr:type II toxin-antitoxin system HicB family antitoxin [Alphaproteobacteria bacterium]
MHQYIGLIHKELTSDYGVSFPDFPGVVTAGASLEEARELAEQALAFHVEGLIDDGEAVPDPASLEKVMADADRRVLKTIIVPLSTR